MQDIIYFQSAAQAFVDEIFHVSIIVICLVHRAILISTLLCGPEV